MNQDILKLIKTVLEHDGEYAAICAIADIRDCTVLDLLDKLQPEVIAQLCECNTKQIEMFNPQEHVIVPSSTRLADLKTATVVTKDGKSFTADRASIVNKNTVVMTNETPTAHSLNINGKAYGDSKYIIAESTTIAYIAGETKDESNETK